MNQDNKIKTCLNCSYLLFSDSSSSGYRCGKTYFSIAPIERRVGRMDMYPEVEPIDNCGEWKAQNTIK